MTQENILVSPQSSVCLKPGAQTPRFRPSVLGDTDSTAFTRCQRSYAASKSQHSGQRRLYPIADRACPQDSKHSKKSVTSNRPSVTHVLDQKCYLCPDPTPQPSSLRTQHSALSTIFPTPFPTLLYRTFSHCIASLRIFLNRL